MCLPIAFSQPALAEKGAPFQETAAYLSVLLGNESDALAKGLHREKLGELNLPGGRIIAFDPLLMMGSDAGFSQTVTPGHYEVSVYWVESKDWGKRNAFAMIRFSDTEVKTWRMAVTAMQDIDKLKPDEFYGYGVDAGMGAFLSPEGFMALTTSMTRAEKEITNYSNYYDDVLAKDLERTDPSRLLYAPPTDPEKNIAMFASGFGDGSYPSYFGFDRTGKPVVLVTTFFVVDQPPPLDDQIKDPAEKAN